VRGYTFPLCIPHSIRGIGVSGRGKVKGTRDVARILDVARVIGYGSRR
tara:strand:+ start:14831 stop:14974 length:144 start_codon:yes stop_codon:yes gene_type:complete